MKHPTASADLAGTATHEMPRQPTENGSGDAKSDAMAHSAIFRDRRSTGPLSEDLGHTHSEPAWAKSLTASADMVADMERRINDAVKSGIDHHLDENKSPWPDVAWKVWLDAVVAEIAPGWDWISGPDDTEDGFRISLTGPKTMDGDALAGGKMAREMARHVNLKAGDILWSIKRYGPNPDDPAGEQIFEGGCSIVATPRLIELGITTLDVTGALRLECPERTAPDTRKPWTEPTVTELPKHPASAKLTIAGGIDIVPRSLDGEAWGPDRGALTKRINESLTPKTTASEIQALMSAIAVDWDYQLEFEHLGLAPLVTPTHHTPMIPLNKSDAEAIAGVDLPNPQPVDALIRDLTQEAKWLGGDDAWGNTDWHAGPKGFDGKIYAADIRAAITEIQRQAAEISELREVSKALLVEIVELNKPRLPTQTNNGELYFDQLVSEIPSDWSSQGYISRMHEVTDMASVGRSLIGVIAEITRPGGGACKGIEGWVPADSPVEIITDLLNMVNDRDAEIAELQGMLEEAIGPVRLVSELATMTDTECDFLDAGDLRAKARNKLDGDFTLPRLYGEAEREHAKHAIVSLSMFKGCGSGEIVDTVAMALGLERAP